MPDAAARPPSQNLLRLRYVLTSVALAVAAMGFAVLVKALLLEVTGANAGFIAYVPAVAVAAWYRGLLGGLLATALGAIADSVLFTPALFVAAADLQNLQVRLFAYLAGGTAVSYLSRLLRNERDRARRESAERSAALERAAVITDELGRRRASDQRAAEMRDAFNSVVSHELRTPITAILGGAKLLARRDRPLDETTRQELLEDLESEAERLYRLVEDLLVLSRSEGGSIERHDDPVALGRLVGRVVRSEQVRWPGVRFMLSGAGDVTVRGDDTYVEQVLRNLLSNAAKYSPNGGEIDVILDEVADGVRVRVLDSGVGLRDEEIDRLFALYYRSPDTSGKVGGAGIGLFVCRVLVEAMGGRIWGAPRPGGGAEFGFMLERQSDDDMGAEKR
jgi:signal transduction histidine kinase